jgi:hypothetical protein
VRADFTPEQSKRYEEILRGRKDVESQRDAVETVLIEGKLPKGVCCQSCMRKLV